MPRMAMLAMKQMLKKKKKNKMAVIYNCIICIILYTDFSNVGVGVRIIHQKKAKKQQKTPSKPLPIRG